jgi:phospholipid N-methyltransferase
MKPEAVQMPNDEERFLEMPVVFDKMVPYLVPQYAFLQESVFDIIRFERDKRFCFLDLGGGSGIQIERVLKRFPNADAVYLDSSRPFMELAKRRLASYEGRVSFVNMTFESNWAEYLKTQPSLVLSMSAIHHLEPEGKQRLYQNVFDILESDGWFINIDEMRSQDDQAYKNAMVFWANYVEEAVDHVPISLAKYYDGWLQFFQRWKARNIQHFGEPKLPGDDIHETPEAQIRYLEQVGFKNVDQFIKYHLWSVIGGQKLAESTELVS